MGVGVGVTTESVVPPPKMTAWHPHVTVAVLKTNF
jgi:hypothetical protein